ncbi:HD domain-containing protein [Anaerovorax odorimutans]|uniref:HD domain-containing protein n=1 Tax=Anaerovorax odorimutans TaxID=109327 RepID=A0ABT1RRP5_9FIRM|nr:HD domain-containing protein [Anaerovorax odorimutans]MCQ4637824.1 HD domain-containing protein [Anaerovorax odorimutans]
MDKVNQIFNHPLYQEALHDIEEAEKDRIFCKHDMDHFLDVARLAYIYNLEENAGIAREMIYSAALLHDIGRALQYTKEIPHHEAGVGMAEQILPECGFSDEEQAQIIDAILFHRREGSKKGSPLRTLLYKADKHSRKCFVCGAREECKWYKENMNMKIDY